MKELIQKLKERNLTIASCESLTGGLFASSLVQVEGASQVFVGSYVTYMDKCKEILLDGKKVLDTVGAISEEMAYLMAFKVKNILDSNIAVSFTGNAGPNASENKEVGLVYSCIIINNEIYNYKNIYSGSRDEIRQRCIEDAKKRILENL